MGEVGKVGTGMSNLKGMATKTVGGGGGGGGNRSINKGKVFILLVCVCVCVCVYVNTIYTCECAQCVQVHRHNN